MAMKIETVQKNIEKIELWMTKKSEMVAKKLILINKAGYMKNETVESVFADNKVADEEIKKSLKDEADQKIISAIYSLSTLTDDVQRKQRELNRMKKIEAELLDKETKLTPEQIEQKQKREAELALRKYIKEELDNIKIPSLEKWLADYEVAYVESANKYLKSYDLSVALQNTKQAVRDQKMNIIIRSFEKVGKLQDIDFGRIGMNGEFNGIVKGEHGTASIRTILAGGYNIQCLHYRVLVK